MKINHVDIDVSHINYVNIEHINGVVENAVVSFVFDNGDVFKCFIDDGDSFDKIDKNIPQCAICSSI